jgi:hypothetical protein
MYSVVNDDLTAGYRQGFLGRQRSDGHVSKLFFGHDRTAPCLGYMFWQLCAHNFSVIWPFCVRVNMMTTPSPGYCHLDVSGILVAGIFCSGYFCWTLG